MPVRRIPERCDGWAGLIFAVYAFNYLWAPIIDRVKIPLLTDKVGHRRGWIVTMQTLIILCLVFWSLIDPSEKIIDYINRLNCKKIRIDKIIFTPEETLIDASKKLKKYNAGAGVVIKNKKLLGIITERDIIKTIK